VSGGRKREEGNGPARGRAGPRGREEVGWVSHPVFEDKTECITICMPGSSSIHIVTSSVNIQQQYHEKRI
jgi:hypothetical protein